MSSPGGLDSEESACKVGDPGSIPGSGRSPGEGNDNPLQHPCLENSMDRGTWQVHSLWGRKEANSTEQFTLNTMLKSRYNNLISERET